MIINATHSVNGCEVITIYHKMSHMAAMNPKRILVEVSIIYPRFKLFSHSNGSITGIAVGRQFLKFSLDLRSYVKSFYKRSYAVTALFVRVRALSVS